MLDSLVFRIHDLRKHESCVKYLYQREFGGIANFAKSVEVREKLKPMYDAISEIPDKDKRKRLEQHMKDFEYAAVDGREFIKRTHIHNYWTDFATGRTFEAKYRAHLPSYHYNLAYAIDFNQDFIEFNFSIPKFLFTTNVFQFVPHYWDKHYSPSYNKDLQSMGAVCYDRFVSFMDWFLEVHLNGHVDKSCVQITRIDFCFNKILSSRDEAMLYISHLKRIRKKFLRSTKIPAAYHNGVYFAHDDYTFKIYHKGDEFKVHDRNKLRAEYSEPQLERLQNFADRMVRYELECKPGLMNTVFKRKIFRADSRKWKRAFRWFGQFRRDGSIISQGKRFYTNPPLCDKDGVEYTKKERREMQLTREQKQLIKYGKYYYDKSFWFMLKSKSTMALSSDAWNLEIETGEFTRPEYQKFGRKMFNGLLQQFRFFVDQFSVVYQDDLRYRMGRIQSMYSDVKNRSRELQEDAAVKSGIPVNEFRKISFSKVSQLIDLLRDKSLSDLKSIIPERTFYRYKKFLELYGFKDYAPVNYVFKADETYETYYSLVEEVKRGINFKQKTPF